jgi:hypothetical protein
MISSRISEATANPLSPTAVHNLELMYGMLCELGST